LSDFYKPIMNINNNQLELTLRVKRWKEGFANTSLTPEDIDELSVHLINTYNEMLDLGLDEKEAWMIATHRIGQPEVLHDEFKKANTEPGPNLNRNWMMLLWGAVSLLILQAVFIVLPLLFGDSILNRLKPSDNEGFLVGEYYTIAVILLLLFVLAIIRSGSIINRFTNSLTKYASLYAIIAIVAGLWAAFCSYILFANYSAFTNGADGGADQEVRRSLSFLMFGFYFPLITITAFATLRYFARETTSFKVFNKNMNWKHAFILGLLAQTPVQFSHAFPGDTNVRASIIIAISVILFLIIGWMISFSKKGMLNLIVAQLVPFAIWIFGSIVNEEARLMFFIFYIVKLIALAAGYYFNRQKQVQISLT
jgi:hypothetical protein